MSALSAGSSSPKIAVLDYGIGNLRSAEKALQHVGADARLIDDPHRAETADALVLPGVGAFGACALALRESGLEPVVRQALADGKPFLAVCIGFQLLYEDSTESPGATGLGVFGGTVGPLPATEKHPQMQWNRLSPVGEPAPGPLHGLEEQPWMYFVHSFAPPVGPETVAVCDYGGPVAAIVARGNLWGTQFHPEKSGRNGLALLANFAALVSCAA